MPFFLSLLPYKVIEIVTRYFLLTANNYTEGNLEKGGKNTLFKSYSDLDKTNFIQILSRFCFNFIKVFFSSSIYLHEKFY